MKTSPIRGMLRLAGRAPSASEKLFSSMCLRARPVIVPFSMYSTWTGTETLMRTHNVVKMFLTLGQELVLKACVEVSIEYSAGPINYGHFSSTLKYCYWFYFRDKKMMCE